MNKSQSCEIRVQRKQNARSSTPFRRGLFFFANRALFKQFGGNYGNCARSQSGVFGDFCMRTWPKTPQALQHKRSVVMAQSFGCVLIFHNIAFMQLLVFNPKQKLFLIQ